MTTDARTRLLAVLFVDQVASTAVLHELGDLDADEFRRAVESILDQSIGENRGRLVKSTGDGCLAVFESASDAIDAGIAMHRGAARANRIGRLPVDIRLRVGVSVGDVTEEDDDYHGSTVVEAARLEQAASSSGMLCTDLVRALAGNRSAAVFEEQVTVEAKGFTEPISSWVVTWEPDSFGPIHQLPAGLGAGGRFDFVGRDAEFAAVRSAWASSIAGETTGILVAGEPGVGKTRLARELALEAMADGAFVLYGRSDDGVGAPFQPISQALEDFVEQASPSVGDLGRFPGELRRLVPELQRHIAELPEAIEADSGTEQYRLFDAVLSWLETTAESAPVLLVVDDLHWSAQPTLQLVRHLLRRSSDARLCVVCTYRNTERDGSSRLINFLGEIQRHGTTLSVDLDGLDESGIDALLHAAGLDAAFTADEAAAIVERLQRQTAGNPFFLGEVLTVLRERGLDGLDAAVPEALGEVVSDRISRLSPLTIELLDVAAVAGTIVSLDVLCVATTAPRADLLDAAEEALAAGLLVEATESPVGYRFQHDLVRSTVYDAMSNGRRSQRHHELAHAIEEVHARDLSDVLDDLAFHYLRSADPADGNRAVIATQLAGEAASEQLGFSTAVEHFVNALQLMNRYGCTYGDDLRGRLTLGLGVALKRAGRKEARAKLLEAAEIAAANDDRDTIVHAALANTRGFFSSAGRTDEARVHLLEMALDAVDPDDSAHAAKLMANLSVELTFKRDDDRRSRLSDESLAMAERIDDKICLAHVINQRIGFFWNARGLGERLRLCRRLQQIADDLGAPQWRYTAASSQFQAAMEDGDLDLADVCVEQMRTTAEELRQPLVVSYLRMRESVRAIVSGDLESGERLATECFEIGQAAGQPDALTFYFGQLINLRFHQGRMAELESIVAEQVPANPGLPSLQAALAVLYCEIDRPDDARAQFEELADRHDELLHDLSWLVTMALLAEACFQLDDADRAARLHEAIEPFRDQCVDNATNWFGSVARSLGQLEHTMGHFAAADASFAHAVERHERMPAPLLLARTRVDWAHSLLHRPAPDRERAADILSVTVADAERLGLQRVHDRAVALLGLL